MLEKATENVYVLKPDISKYRWVTSNIVIVINDADVLVVDSGLLPEAAEEAIKEIRKLTDKPVRYLINTHWHGDHWQGNGAFAKAFPELDIIATDHGYKGIARNGMVWANKLYPKHFQNYVTSYEKSVKEKQIDGKLLNDLELKELKEGLAEMKNDLNGIKRLIPKFPTMTYSESLTIRSGEREIQLLYLGVGNTSGDAIIYLPKEKILIAGDLVVHPSPFESGMFSPEWLETSKKLEALDFNLLIPGHGDILKGHAYLQFLNALYEEVILQVDEAYKNGISKGDEIKDVVTHKTVTDKLSKKIDFREFVKALEPDFVPAAVRNSYLRIIQGKQL